jgi:3-dehydroquinate synthase
MFDPLAATLCRQFFANRQQGKLAVLTDSHTKELCYPKINQALPAHHLITVPAGEEYKNLDTCVMVWQQLTDQEFTRHDLLLIVGGGVPGDLGGFCAATFKRGIAFALMPTTLLAQVDASIGGKVGIDFQQLKNHIGVFQQPLATLISSEFLASLPERELRSGFAEVIKHSLIGDRQQWLDLSARRWHEQDWAQLVPASARFKQDIVTKDPTENGLRKILNFGHTVGHAIESLRMGTPRPLAHGEAIAMGMIAEMHIAFQKKLVSADELRHVTDYLLSTYPWEEPGDDRKLIALMRQDKKNKNNTILLALPKEIGRAIWNVEVTDAEVEEALAYYRSRYT